MRRTVGPQKEESKCKVGKTNYRGRAPRPLDRKSGEERHLSAGGIRLTLRVNNAALKKGESSENLKDKRWREGGKNVPKIGNQKLWIAGQGTLNSGELPRGETPKKVSFRLGLN